MTKQAQVQEIPTAQAQVVPLSAQVTKVGVDTKGMVKLEVGIPLHIALAHADKLLGCYNLNVQVLLP